MRVLVTGANGFLGRCILKELQSQGHQAVAFVRSEKSARTLNDFHCDVHIGSLTSAEDTEKHCSTYKVLSMLQVAARLIPLNLFFKTTYCPLNT